MFSNGSTYNYFTESFCCRCNKYKVEGGEFTPTEDSCKIEKDICSAQFNENKFPYEKLVKGGDCQYICKEFDTDDKELMQEYKSLIELETIEDKKCRNCEYWIENYSQCDHPEQRQDECGEYMAPQEKTCDLWEPNC